MNVGGIVGYDSSSNQTVCSNITCCYNVGKITATTTNSNYAKYVGGISGDKLSSISNCYYLLDSAAYGLGGSTPSNELNNEVVTYVVDEDTLKGVPSGLGSDFVRNEEGYPVLEWETSL